MPRPTTADAAARHFGAAVRAARWDRGETLEDVSRRIPRMDAKYLGGIERGAHAPSIVTAQRIAVALELSLAELVKEL